MKKFVFLILILTILFSGIFLSLAISPKPRNPINATDECIGTNCTKKEDIQSMKIKEQTCRGKLCIFR